MRVIEENESEIYLELDPEDLPLTIESPGKTIYIRMKGSDVIGKVYMDNINE